MAIEGNCLCGAVSYSCDADPVFTALCHCADCQRQTGTASSIVVGVPVDSIQVHGDSLSRYTTIGDDHGGPTHREFCSNCGSPIVSRVEAMPDLVFIKAGTLNDKSWLQPTLEVWGRSAQSWVPPLEGAQRLERGPV